MAAGDLELVYDRKAILGEGPCWYHGHLYWVDIFGKIVHRHTPATNANKEWQLDQKIGTLAPREKGGLILALKNGLHFFDEESGETEFICDPEENLEENRFNDGKCDPAGRFWAGTMEDVEKERKGSLYRLDHDLAVSKWRENVLCSNGLGWSPDCKTMYYIDSHNREIDAYDFDLETGSITNPRSVVRLPDGAGFPDGMTVDCEGMIWLAQWDGFCVARYNPASGDCIEKISLPFARPTACTFGGADLNELYITSARIGIPDSELAGRQSEAGGLFKVKTDTQGIEAFAFKG